MTTLKRASESPDAVDCIIIGTEHGQVHILDSEAFTVVASLTVPSVPVFLAAAGLIDVEYRLIICCRDAKIYTAKRSMTNVEKPTIELPSQAVGIVRIRKQIIVGCMDGFLRCYNVKGKIQWQMQMPSDIITMELMDYHPKNVAAVMVALGNGEIHIYKDIFLIDSIKCDQVIPGLIIPVAVSKIINYSG